MVNKEKAAEHKAKGNIDFQAKRFAEAIEHFTEAIKEDPTDHVFFSNRSACYASLEKYDKALEDGEECVKLKPDWAKGYTRKGLAEHFLGKFDAAIETYKAGLKLAPEDATLKEGLKKATEAKEAKETGGSSFGGLSFNPAALAAAASRNPRLASYFQDKDLMQKVMMIMKMGESSMPNTPQGQMLMQMVQQDERVLEVILGLQGADLEERPKEETTEAKKKEENKEEKVEATDTPSPGVQQTRKAETPPPSSPPAKRTKTEEPKKEPVAADNRTDAQKEADIFKAKGNELYKKRKFAEALEMYDAAIEKEPNDILYVNNKCAVWTEMGPEYYDKALETLSDVVARRYEINTANPGGASFEKIAKVFSRMASIYEKKKDFDKSIEFYNKSLMEDNNRHTRTTLRDVERAKEKFDRDAYLDPSKAEGHREKGNEFFKEKKFVEAKAEYDEAIKRNPKDAKLYSNRAATLTKLMAYPDALRDLEECIKLDPKFVRAYSRKGAAHFFMKEFHKALKAYEEGLKIDPDNEECKMGRQQVIAKISATTHSKEVDEEQIRHAMADPEIQQILHDPQIKMFLGDLQRNPVEAQKAMRADAKLAEAVEKLMAAGIIRTG
mmetsp:Transcript_96606/g.201906  ORF Transcript_96606/g.201906 Transcript_96606/m.201906 type:complete len:611 (-) Transcript_96606:110-1942(-)|eukprot:CAMPEP_0206445858 /NCGR_PEP_ID=MMETSP0324_2-20121206/15778_1 /ASSEMBLY_ACC=CAM_ASM_000836 /TAXON_ID=2866 /ORGANISM="Crypthecodinium cohnii, Strain Seligo" /LENGTH=610 /DNA_ID=CAMNT_0053914193 /DNA_START=93 /DNA_END=1928 /DNA_ORIENTATION=+